MQSLLAFVRRVVLACALAWLATALLPGEALAATCGPATGQGTAPADFRTYCWLDFSTYNDATARTTGGQSFTFNLPDGTTVAMTLKARDANPALTSVAVPSWTGSAFGNSAFNGIPGKPILYTAANGTTVTLTISNISVVPPSGGSAQYSIVVGDGESSNDGETLSFTTDGSKWQQIAKIQNGTSTLYPTVAGVNTTTVKETGVAGTVGSYVFRSDGNPKTVTAVVKGSGLQGIIVGMRYASISVVSQITGTRYNAADQFTYKLATTTGTTLDTETTSGTATSGFAVASVPTIAASYPFVVSQAMAAGSVGTLANYTTTLTCTNSSTDTTTSLPNNLAASSYTFPNLRYGDAVLCTFTNTPIFNSIAGTVYNDANHNGSQDATESGLGISGVYVKVAPVAGGVCTGPATQAIAVTPATGAYTLPNLAQGTYCVILDNNGTLGDITSNPPPGWLPTQNASGVLQVVVPAGAPTPTPQSFGLYNGSRLTGTVFADNGLGSGTANNGSKDGTEAGLGGVTVTATASAAAVASAVTTGDGGFTLWVPASVTTSVTLAATAPSGYGATGGSAGTTGGAYARPLVTYTAAAGQVYSGVAFGLVGASTLVPNGAETGAPGTVVFYAHTFTAATGGQVTFSLAQAATPAAPAWTAVLYQDTNCSAALDGGEPVNNTALTVAAGQQVCLVVKQFVPAGIGYGALNKVTVTATFSYAGATPALANAVLTVTDLTTSGEASALALKKMVSNVTRGGSSATSVNASPGEVLQYTLTATNNGSGPLSTLVINDATPAFTTFVSAACPGTLASGITACSLGTQPGVGSAGSLQWTFTGTLPPGGQLAVTYQVKLSQ